MGFDLFLSSTIMDAVDPDGLGKEFDTHGSEAGEVNCASAWVDPMDLQLKHRIGRGPFGDVWLATLRSPNDPASVEREVAVKMLTLSDKGCVHDILLTNFDTVFQACHNLKGVALLEGISKKKEKACVIMKKYKGSVGGKMAFLTGNLLNVEDALRYAIDIARGVLELHSHGIMVLNLKACNFLLDEDDRAVVGEHGIPLLLLRSITSCQYWLGTPNYMAPEQWDATRSGPVTFGTDAWGFGCSLLEMLTGLRPWEGMSSEQIYNKVVLKQVKPAIPKGLPAGLEKMLQGCFEYDFRDRPTFYDILQALSSPNLVYKLGDWVCEKGAAKKISKKNGTPVGVVKKLVDNNAVLIQYPEKTCILKVEELQLWRDQLCVGDKVRIRCSPSDPCCWCQDLHENEGTIVAVDKENILVTVKFCRVKELWRGDPAELEKVSLGISVGDWVHRRTDWTMETNTRADQAPSCIGVVHNILNDGRVQVAFVGRETLWTGSPMKLTKTQSMAIGQTIKLGKWISRPRYDWPPNRHAGRVTNILPNGCLVLASGGPFWFRNEWWADPAEVEVMYTTKSQKIGQSHWSTGPILSTVGLIAAAKLGAAFGRKVKGREQENMPAERVEERDPPPPPVQEEKIASQPLNKNTTFIWLASVVSNTISRMASQFCEGLDGLY